MTGTGRCVASFGFLLTVGESDVMLELCVLLELVHVVYTRGEEDPAGIFAGRIRRDLAV